METTRTMIQPQWPGFARTIDPQPFARTTTPFADISSAEGELARTFGTTRSDGLARPWWTCGTGAIGNGNGNGNPFGNLWGGVGTGGSLASMITGIIAQLQQLVSGFMGESAAQGGAQQQFSNLDVSSTGDPHIAAVGTRTGPGGGAALNEHYDSMTAHDDLVHSTDVAGGYRVSTTVTQPGTNGVTANQSATVHANYGWDQVTMNRDGSFAIADDGESVQLAAGSSRQLSGGETVTRNQDGSLTVTAANDRGGTIATTLRAIGGGVDVTTHAQNLAVGGDVVNHDAEPQPIHRGHAPGHGHGHKHHRHPTVLTEQPLTGVVPQQLPPGLNAAPVATGTVTGP
jgi:hypothetical protein